MARLVNYYEILGVSRGATPDEVRRRFRDLARERHPDRFSGEMKARAEAEFQTLTEAFNILTNPERRERHDFDLDNKVVSESDPKAIAQAYLAKGIEAYRDQRWEAAFSNFEMALHHDPESGMAQHHFAMAAARFPARLRKAIEAVDKALRLEPKNIDYQRDAASIFRQAGLWTRAEKCYLEALKWHPDSAELRRGLEEVRSQKAATP